MDFLKAICEALLSQAAITAVTGGRVFADRLTFLAGHGQADGEAWIFPEKIKPAILLEAEDGGQGEGEGAISVSFTMTVYHTSQAAAAGLMAQIIKTLEDQRFDTSEATVASLWCEGGAVRGMDEDAGWPKATATWGALIIF